jgi:hypothetical protein
LIFGGESDSVVLDSEGGNRGCVQIVENARAGAAVRQR